MYRQYSLRALFGVVLLAALAVWPISLLVHSHHRERALADRIEALGGRCILTPRRGVSLGPQVSSVWIAGTDLTRESSLFAGLSRLREVQMISCELSADQFCTLMTTASLEEADFTGSTISGDTEHGWECGPRVVALIATDLKVSREVLGHAVRGESLIWVYLGGTPCDDFVVESFPSPCRVEVLDLSHTKVSGRSLAVLARWPHLHALSLRGTAVNDKDVSNLAAATKLARLDLRETAVTEEGIRVIADSLPGCELIAK